jgi:hypothetical protein
MAQAAREWRRSTEEAEHLVRHLGPPRVIEVRYEDLCRTPQETLRPVFQFIGVDPDAMAINFRDVEHHIVGNGMRLDSDNNIQLDERWRTALSPTDLDAFDSVAGSLRRRLGYL